MLPPLDRPALHAGLGEFHMTAMRFAAAAALVLALRNGPARAEASDSHHSPARASATHAVPCRNAVSPKGARATRASKTPLRRTVPRDRTTDLELPQLG